MAVRRLRERLRVEPLWRRVERNRLRLALFTAGFLTVSAAAAVVIVMPAAWVASVLILAYAAGLTAGPTAEALFRAGSAVAAYPGWFTLGASALGVLVGGWHVRRSLSRPLRAQLGALGAKWVQLESLPETRRALKDMAIAAGVTDPAPDLFVLDSTGVNAFLIARGGQQPIAVVTTALAKRFDAEEQRAVFANLMARYLAGDVHWATAVSAVMSPLWRWRDRDLSGDHDAFMPKRVTKAHLAGDTRGARYVSTAVHITPESDAAQAAARSLVLAAPLGIVAYMVAVVVSELVMAGHRSSQLVASEKADSEGMLLLKDPRVMLRALCKAVEADNRVRLGVPMYAGLFYIWAGDDLAGDEDPEWQRIARLREVVGVDGAVDADEDAERLVAESLALAEVVPPPAPRLESLPAAPAPARGQARSGGAERLGIVIVGCMLFALPLRVLQQVTGVAGEAGAEAALLAPFAAAGAVVLTGEAWVGTSVALAAMLAAAWMLGARIAGGEYLPVVYLSACLVASFIGCTLGAVFAGPVRDAFSDLARRSG